jgi:hypothetical protein
MAMNKKEQAEMESLREQLRLAKALCWPTSPKPVPLTSDEIKTMSQLIENLPIIGWFGFGWEGGWRVSQGCSNGTSHSTHFTTKTSSQGCGRIFRTRDEAFLMARWEACETSAKMLANIDKEWGAGK